MKKIILSHIILISIFTVYSSALTQATETVTINSYLPGPIANVQTLRLNPHTETTTLGCLEGTTYIDTSGNFKICKDNGAGSTDYYYPSSDWASSGDYLYPTDTAINPNLRVGIGTSTPTSALDVNGSTVINDVLTVGHDILSPVTVLIAKGDATINNTLTTATIINQGSITSGSLNAGTVSITNVMGFGGSTYMDIATVYNKLTGLTLSDQRFKTDIKPLTHALTTVLQLNPIKYHLLDIQKDAAGKIFTKNELQPDEKLGLLAQEVYKILPEAVKKPADESKESWGVFYEELIPLLIQAVKEHKAETDILKTQITKGKAETDMLRTQIDELKRHLMKLESTINHTTP